MKKPRDASLLKARLERTLKKTNKRIAAGWSDPLAQKARIEQRIVGLTPA